MSIELKMLCFSILLGFVELIAASQMATQERGIAWNLSSREEKLPDLTGAAGRMDRAFKNFMQTFPFFAAAVFLVHVAGRASWISVDGAVLYFSSRVIHWIV